MELAMDMETLIVTRGPKALTITFNRLQSRNSINTTVLKEMNQVLDIAERDRDCRLVIIEGKGGVFCTGMDFEEITQKEVSTNTENLKIWIRSYMSLLKRFTLISKVIIAKLDGQVLAGGVGLVAASDLVIATERTQFSLSEALWGLLPANVMPYLIRRVGFQKAYAMTLTTQTITAQDAKIIHLIDEINSNLDDAIRRLMLRLVRLDEKTIKDMKAYFRKMWIITEEMEEVAVNELSRLVTEPRVYSNIKNFIKYQRFPWDR